MTDTIHLQSPAIRKLAAVELMSAVDLLPKEVKSLFSVSNASLEGLAELLDVHVCIDKVFQYARKSEARRWMEDALRFLIKRQAHFPLLKALYPSLSPSTVSQIREQISAQRPSTRVSSLTSEQIDTVYRCWQAVAASTPDDVERWVKVALIDELAQFELATIYRVVEGRV
jgi:hypothetical protein